MTTSASLVHSKVRFPWLFFCCNMYFKSLNTIFKNSTCYLLVDLSESHKIEMEIRNKSLHSTLKPRDINVHNKLHPKLRKRFISPFMQISHSGKKFCLGYLLKSTPMAIYLCPILLSSFL